MAKVILTFTDSPSGSVRMDVKEEPKKESGKMTKAQRLAFGVVDLVQKSQVRDTRSLELDIPDAPPPPKAKPSNRMQRRRDA